MEVLVVHCLHLDHPKLAYEHNDTTPFTKQCKIMMYLASAQMDTSYLKNAKTINNIAKRKFAIYWTGYSKLCRFELGYRF